MDREPGDLTLAKWKKSSRSGESGGNCVEIADNIPGIIAMRDSKNPNGPILRFTISEWHAFLNGVKNGEFDIELRVS
ncbi:hypothetical protein HNP84_003608 [Thermocatellispora tengchongensis]|uniref:DUF397 domain-containing protein n=1 Tax=Thermocatellispora tengchongensis TaxID=1073253 RepID=A0A840P3D5_9ACTN|nr:DUF397 domain-containing protein [Thermocatellispora tengchongensis]MBB5133882.1 hypothetical protein [Thermocatellispora tengchongensis]